MSPGIPASAPPRSARDRLVVPAIRRYLESYVRRRVRPEDAEDTVQSVLCAAIEAPRIPAEDEELRRWLTGIARRKIADAWARASREAPTDETEVASAAPPIEERALARWAEREATAYGGDAAARTLAWMAREGDGETLEAIAAEEREPAARVRQRVSRLRRWLRARWSAEIAAATALVVALAVAIVAWLVLARRPAPVTPIAPRPSVVRDVAPATSVVAPPPSSAPSPAPAPMPSVAPSATPSPRATTPTPTPTSTAPPIAPRPTRPRATSTPPTGSST